jgi:membrane protease YdiL (CAAX protease family)
MKQKTLHVVLIAAVLCIMAGMPSMPAIAVIGGLQKSADSRVFEISFRLQKLILGILMLFATRRIFRWKAPRPDARAAFQNAAIYSLAGSVALLGPALATHYVRWDPKLPPQAALWMLHNLVFVCLGEELIFRGYIQEGLGRLLKKRKYGAALALFTASVIFGLSHFRDGAVFVGLATIAGVFYGLAYLRSGLVTAVATHFLVNLIHFLGFSYPALMRHQ